MSSRRTLILIAAVLVGAVAAFALWTYTAPVEEDGNDPPTNLSGEYASECDQYGNRVYVTEDDTGAAPSIFVVPDDCVTDDE